MCLVAPSRVTAVRDGMAVTECFGQVREISLLLMDEEALALMRELMAQGGDARNWGDDLVVA